MTAAKLLRFSGMSRFNFESNTQNALALDAAGDAIAGVMQHFSPNTEEITHVGFRYHLRTGTPPTYRVSIQTVGTNGIPSGTIYESGQALGTFTPPADATWNSTYQWIALNVPAFVSGAAAFAVVIDYSAGTINGSNNSSFTSSHSVSSTSVQRPGFPYVVNTDGGSSVKINSCISPLAVKTASGNVHGTPHLNHHSSTALGTAGHRAALRFLLPAGLSKTYQLAGVSLAISPPASGSTFRFGLWDGSTELQGLEHDSDFLATNAAAVQTATVFFPFAVPLNFGSPYRVGIQRTGVACSLYHVDIGAADDAKAYPGGTDFYLSTWNGSDWTDVPTSIPHHELILRDMTQQSFVFASPRRRFYTIDRCRRFTSVMPLSVIQQIQQVIVPTIKKGW